MNTPTWILTAILSLILCTGSAHAVNLIERIEADLAADRGLSAADRDRYLEAFRQRLGAYAFDVLKGERLRGAEVVMTILTEGSFDQAEVERTVGLAFAAYQAISRGAPADVVEGIALYGFRKQLGADLIADWANGVNQLLKADVPLRVAQDLVYNAQEHGWDLDEFRTFKNALIQAKLKGHDPVPFSCYLFGNYDQRSGRPGEMMGRALRAFRQAADRGRLPKLPKYDSPLYKHQAALPTPDKPKPDVPKPDKPKPDKPKPDVPKPDKPKPDKPGLASGDRPKRIGRLMLTLESFLGTPYVWGGETRKGTDCSGLTQSSYAAIEVKIGRRVRDQWLDGVQVTKKALKKGDILFFITIGKTLSHVGMVTDPGKGEFIHASSSRGVVRSYLKSSYYAQRYAGARRVLP